MTSTPVRDASSLMNYVRQKGVPAPNGSGKTGGFDSAMNKAADRMNDRAPVETAAKPAPPHRPAVRGQAESNNPAAETNRREPTVTDARPADTETVDPAAVESAEAIGQEAVQAVAAELNVTEEEVLAAMEALGMVPLSLLDMRNLTTLVLQLTGEDSTALMTNENLYGQLNQLMETVTALTGDLMNQTGLNEAQLTALLSQAAENGPPAAVTVPDGNAGFINPNARAEAEAEANLTEAGKEITIVVEKNGVTTEITAAADENGNLQAVKEAVTTAGPVNTGEGAGAGANSNQTSEGEGQQEQEMTGRSSLLDQLLQNRTNAAESFEPVIPAAAAPDTEQIMKQILDFMKVSLKPEMNRLEMQLNPANLGTVHVEIASKDGVITAQFTAQNDLVKATIESQLVELKENMRAQGLKVESVEVNVQSQSFDSQLWQGREGNDANEQQHRPGHRRINLNELDLEELPDDMTVEEKLSAEIMAENGGTVDMTA